MRRSADERITDILKAIDRCRSYRQPLSSDDTHLKEMAFDAVLRNFSVIGEAVRALPAEITQPHPEISWPSIVGLRNVVVHEYFDIRTDVILDVLDNHLEQLAKVLQARPRTGAEHGPE